MCITTGGLFTPRRLINLKRSVEISGNIISTNPTAHTCEIFRGVLALAFLIILAVRLSDIQPNALSIEQSFTEYLSCLTILFYLAYLAFATVFALLHSRYPSQNDLYYGHICISLLLQCAVSTAFQIFCYDILGGQALFDSMSILLRISMLIIIIEFMLSLMQFTYFYGAIPLFLYNLVYVLLFHFALKQDGDSSIDYVSWIILCIVWHFALFVHFKNWINYKWFTSPKISRNVHDFQLLSTNSSAAEASNAGKAGYASLIMGSCVDQRKKTLAVYQAMHREESDIVLLLGDNVYADLAPPTITKYMHRIIGTERVFKEEYDRLLHHKDFRPKFYDSNEQIWLALWDDHDYGENDAAREYAEKQQSKAAFVDFLQQLQVNGGEQQMNDQIAAMKADEHRGTYYVYDYVSDIVRLRIIMMDARFDRAEDESDIMGDAQWAWLEEQVKEETEVESEVDWYLICYGSPLLNEGRGGKKTVGQETRNKLFSILRANDGKLMKKTLLLSGDLHYSIWHNVDDELYELTASSITHSKPWFCCKCWLKFLEIEEYQMAKQHDGNGATGKSEPIKKNSFGSLRINKNEFHYCVKDAFGYEYLHLSHVKK